MRRRLIGSTSSVRSKRAGKVTGVATRLTRVALRTSLNGKDQSLLCSDAERLLTQRCRELKHQEVPQSPRLLDFLHPESLTEQQRLGVVQMPLCHDIFRRELVRELQRCLRCMRQARHVSAMEVKRNSRNSLEILKTADHQGHKLHASESSYLILRAESLQTESESVVDQS